MTGTVIRGDPTSRSFSLIYTRENRVIALDCVNATKDYAQGRALVVAGTVADAERLAGVAALKELVTGCRGTGECQAELILAGHLQPVLLQQVVQCRAADAEQLGGG